MKTIIIDDEQLARDIVKKYLENNADIEIVAECSNGFEGVKAINELKPDLVILDIQMPKLTGFEMLELIDHKPQIIFATAYDEFAIKAFENNAIDYLLKPFAKDRFDQALAKVKLPTKEKHEDNIKSITDYRDEQVEKIDRIVVKQNHKITVIPVEDIKYIEAQDDYVMIYTPEGRFLKQKTMKYFESHLSENEFVRIHRSFIAKVDQIEELQRYEKESFIVKLKTGEKLKVSKTGYQKLKEVLNI
jgi:two-component system, LytTR family, response regulator